VNLVVFGLQKTVAALTVGLIMRHLWRDSNARQECSRLDRNEL